MADTLPPLTTNEFALLEIMKQGEYIADLGEHSRWSEPLKALVARGLVMRHDQFNHGITDAGRAAVEAVGDDDMRQLIEVNNDRIRARQRAELATPLFSDPSSEERIMERRWTSELMTPLFSEPSPEMLMAMNAVLQLWVTLKPLMRDPSAVHGHVKVVIDTALKWESEGRFR